MTRGIGFVNTCNWFFGVRFALSNPLDTGAVDLVAYFSNGYSSSPRTLTRVNAPVPLPGLQPGEAVELRLAALYDAGSALAGFVPIHNGLHWGIALKRVVTCVAVMAAV